MRAIDASRTRALWFPARERRGDRAPSGVALLMLLIWRRLPTCNRRVNAERRIPDVQPPTAPLLAPVRHQLVSESKSAGEEIPLGGRAVVDIEVASLLCGETRPRGIASRLGDAVADERSPIAQHGLRKLRFRSCGRREGPVRSERR